MRKKIIYIFIVLIAILFQTSVLPVLGKTNSVADSVLMLVLAWSVIDGFAGFLGWAITAGILYDLAAYEVVGIHVLIFLSVIYFVSFFSRRFSVELKGTGIVLMGFFVIVATLFSHVVYAAASAISTQSLQGFWKIFGNIGNISLQIIYNAVALVICFFIIKRVKNFFML